MRAPNAFDAEELAVVEDLVKSQIGVRALRPQGAPVDGVSGLNHGRSWAAGEAVPAARWISRKGLATTPRAYLQVACENPRAGTASPPPTIARDYGRRPRPPGRFAAERPDADL